MLPNQPPQPALAGGPPMAPPQAQPFPASPPAQGNAPPPVTIDAVVQLLRDDCMRGFRIDIETDSLVEADQTQEKQDATELVAAIGGFFKEFGPIVQTMPPLAPLASGLLQFAVRRHKAGAELEELIEKCMGDVVEHLANPPPPQASPIEQAKLQITQEKGQAEIGKAQLAVQEAQTKAQGDARLREQAARHAEAEDARKAALHQMDVEAKQIAHAHDMAAREKEMARAEQLHNLAIGKMHHDAGIKAATAEHGAAIKQDANEHGMALKEQQAKVAAKTSAGERPKDDTKSKLEKLIATVEKALKSRKVIRDKNGDIIGIEHG